MAMRFMRLTTSTATASLATTAVELTGCRDHLEDHLFISFGRTPLTGDEDHVQAARQLPFVAAKRLPNEALDAISHVRATHLAAHRHPQPSRPASIPPPEDDEMRGDHAVAVALDGKIFASFSETKPLGQPLARGWVHFLYVDTVNLLRPFCRRRSIIVRPLLVCIRARKPWVRRRETLLG
jgi:hypothetical protein